MSCKPVVMLLLVMFLGVASVAMAGPPPRECTPEPADPDSDGKQCPSGGGRQPTMPPPPVSVPDAQSVDAWLSRVSAQLLDRVSLGRGRDGR